jgi:hypothetical protein
VSGEITREAFLAETATMREVFGDKRRWVVDESTGTSAAERVFGGWFHICSLLSEEDHRGLLGIIHMHIAEYGRRALLMGVMAT